MSPRIRILDAADRLFTEQGIRAVGVDAVVAAADTAKTTLYAHFGSKDGLVVAYLRRRSARQRERFVRGLAAHGGGPVERILHLYDLLAVELAEPGYRGSPFARARVELGDDHPAAAVAAEHRRWLLATFTTLVAGTAVQDPDALAAQLLLLHEAAAQAGGDAARTARNAAGALLAAAPLGAAAEAIEQAQARPPTPSRVPDDRSCPPPRQGPAAPAGGGPESHPGPASDLEVGPRSTVAPGALVVGDADVPTPPPITSVARHPAGGSPEAHRLIAFLNSAHLPDGDDQLADERAGAWIADWLAAADRSAPAARGGHPVIAAAPPELLVVREGLRALAAANCGDRPDPHLVAEAAALLERTPLLVDIAGGGEPRLTPAATVDHIAPHIAPHHTAAHHTAAHHTAAHHTAAEAGHTTTEAVRLVLAVVAGDYLAVRARGEWPRLKVCGSPDCRWAFVDTTRNRSRRWCDMAGCGNRAKNRAWRSRQAPVTIN